MDYHGTFEKYKETKAKLFQELIKRLSIINIDDSFGKKLSKQISCEVVPFSRKNKIGTYFKNIGFTTQGIKGTIKSFNKEIKIESNLMGNLIQIF